MLGRLGFVLALLLFVGFLATPSLSQPRLAKESIFDSLSQEESTTQISPTAPAIQTDCGDEQECVKKSECKTEKVNQHGNYVISWRSIFKTCSYLETCCHISDRIVSNNDDVSNNDVMAECGTRHVNGVGITLKSSANQEAEFGEFPWVVTIMVRTAESLETIGGGSILAPNVVMTAAHKVENLTANALTVRAGEWDRKSVKEPYPHVDRNVSEILIHDRYSKTSNIANNIALLVLKMIFSNNPHISPICLPSVQQNFDYSRCIVTGWGSTPNSAEYQNILKKITVPIVPRDKCLDMLHSFRYARLRLDVSYICAGGEMDVDSCLGDGGAPLVCPVPGYSNRYVQAGIVAWGISCGKQNIPAAYSNVAHLMPWVSEQLDRLGVGKKYYTL